jgi:CRP/FNR family cyclic AMP-dependent transcriptional regulator
MGVNYMNLLEIFENSDDLLKFPEGTMIFEEGSTGDFMYVIMEGKVRFSLRDEPLGEALAGGIVGEMALLDSADRSATATAATDCLLAPIDLHSFKMLIQHTPDFALHVMNVLADRLRHANEKIVH